MRPNRRGFTLPEVLTAVTLAALLLGVLFSLYWSVTRTVNEQAERRQGGAALDAALERLVRDLQGAQLAPGYEEGGLELQPQADAAARSSTLELCTTRPVAGWGEPRDARWFEVVNVRYWVESDAPGGGKLLRSERALAGPESTTGGTTNTLFHGVTQFTVEFYGEDDWVDEWQIDPDEENPSWPRAARIQLEPSTGIRGVNLTTVETVIPRGWSFSPETDRVEPNAL